MEDAAASLLANLTAVTDDLDGGVVVVFDAGACAYDGRPMDQPESPIMSAKKSSAVRRS